MIIFMLYMTPDFSSCFNQGNAGFGPVGNWGGGQTGRENPVDPYPNPNPDCINGCIQGNNPDCPKCPWADCCKVYGGLINSNAIEMWIPLCSRGHNIPLDGPLPTQNVALNGINNLRVQCSGTYQITIFGNFSVFGQSGVYPLQFYVKANGHRIEESVVGLDVSPDGPDEYSFERTVFVRLCANTTLAMTVDQWFPDCPPGGIQPGPYPVPNQIRLDIPAKGFHMEIKRVGSFTGK